MNWLPLDEPKHAQPTYYIAVMIENNVVVTIGAVATEDIPDSS